MFGGPVAIVQVPAKFAFNPKDAAEFLSLDISTLREKTDLGLIKCRREGKRRKYLLEDLIEYAKSLPNWTAYGNQ